MSSHTKMTVYTETGLMPTDFEKYLYEKVNGDILHKYVISEKYKIEREVLTTVDWPALGDTPKL